MAFVSGLATGRERRTSQTKGRDGRKGRGGLGKKDSEGWPHYKQALQVSVPAVNTGEYTSFILPLKRGHLPTIAWAD